MKIHQTTEPYKTSRSRFNYQKSCAAATSFGGDGDEGDNELNELEMLAAHRFLSKWHNNKKTFDTKEKKEAIDRNSDVATIVCWNCDQSGLGLQACLKQRTRLICYGCGKKDETILTCPKCSKSVKANVNGVNAVTTTHNADEFEVVFYVNNMIYEPPNDNRPHANVKLNCIEVTGLLDTGAHVTVIGMNHLSAEEKRSIQKWMKPTNIGIRTADNTIHKAVGMLKSEYSYHGRFACVQTIVMPNTSKKLLLGMDFMKAFNIGLMDCEFIKKELYQLINHLLKSAAAAQPKNSSAQAPVVEANAFDSIIYERQYNAHMGERPFDKGDLVWVANQKPSSPANGFTYDSTTKKIKAIVVSKVGENTYQLIAQNGRSLGFHSSKHMSRM